MILNNMNVSDKSIVLKFLNNIIIAQVLLLKQQLIEIQKEK